MSAGKPLLQNAALEELGIHGATIGGATMDALGHALATNSTLRTLYLDVNDGSMADMAPLARGIREGAMSGKLKLESLHIVARERDLDD